MGITDQNLWLHCFTAEPVACFWKRYQKQKNSDTHLAVKKTLILVLLVETCVIKASNVPSHGSKLNASSSPVSDLLSAMERCNILLRLFPFGTQTETKTSDSLYLSLSLPFSLPFSLSLFPQYIFEWGNTCSIFHQKQWANRAWWILMRKGCFQILVQHTKTERPRTAWRGAVLDFKLLFSRLFHKAGAEVDCFCAHHEGWQDKCCQQGQFLQR